jgi:hypothetical protein
VRDGRQPRNEKTLSVQLTVVSTEAEESPLLRAVTRKRLVESVTD